MYLRMYALIAGGFILAFSYWCFLSNGADSLGLPVFVFGGLPTLVFVHIFIKRNRSIIEKLTIEPSEMNFKLMNEMIFGKKKD